MRHPEFRMFLEFAAVLSFMLNFQTLKPKFLYSDLFQWLPFSILLFDLAPFFESFFNQTLGESSLSVDFSVEVHSFLKCFGLLEIAETFRSSVKLPELKFS